jgi:YtcA family
MKPMHDRAGRRRFARHSKSGAAAFVISCNLGTITGCGRAPSFNILGSFFPAWLICMITGVLLAAIANWLLVRYKLEKEIAWKILVFPCLAAFFAFTLWLVFFS